MASVRLGEANNPMRFEFGLWYKLHILPGLELLLFCLILGIPVEVSHTFQHQKKKHISKSFTLDNVIPG